MPLYQILGQEYGFQNHEWFLMLSKISPYDLVIMSVVAWNVLKKPNNHGFIFLFNAGSGIF